MAVLSTCRNFGRVVPAAGRLLVNQMRQGGHGNVLVIKPGDYHWRKFKDQLHFHVMIGLIPLFLFASYHNIRYGPCELTETPEGYRPQYYEYQKHPVTRFIVKHLMSDPQKLYELRMACLDEEIEKVTLRRIEEQVTNVMRARNDYKAWFYQPFTGKDSRKMRDVWTVWEDRTGTKEPVFMREAGGYENYDNPVGPGSMKRL